MCNISKHAAERCQERLGMNREDVKRFADEALLKGVVTDELNGAFEHYISHRETSRVKLIVYKNVILVYDTKNDVLITAYNLLKFREEYTQAQSRKEEVVKIKEKAGILDNMITQSKLKSLGWTKRMIDVILPKPVVIKDEESNMYIKLYDKKTVIKAMEEYQYKNIFKKTNKGKKALAKCR